MQVFAAQFYFDEDHEKDALTKVFTEGNIGNVLALEYIGNIFSSEGYSRSQRFQATSVVTRPLPSHHWGWMLTRPLSLLERLSLWHQEQLRGSLLKQYAVKRRDASRHSTQSGTSPNRKLPSLNTYTHRHHPACNTTTSAIQRRQSSTVEQTIQDCQNRRKLMDETTKSPSR